MAEEDDSPSEVLAIPLPPDATPYDATSLPALLTSGTASGLGSQGRVLDLDGDGTDDLVVDLLTSRAPDELLVFHGPIALGSDPDDADARLVDPTVAAFTLLDVGDVDGDGHQDLLVGDPLHDRGRGVAAVFRGPHRGARALDRAYLVVRGEHAGARVGAHGLLTDLDLDGSADLVLGAPGWSEEAIVVIDPDSGIPCVEDDQRPKCGDPDTALDLPFAFDATGAVGIWLAPAPGEHTLGDAHTRVVPHLTRREFPMALFAPGDMDGDGWPDVVATHLEDFGPGEVVRELQQRVATVLGPCGRPTAACAR